MPPGITPFTLRPGSGAAGVLEDDLVEPRAERQLVEAGPHHVARHAEDRGAGALLGAEAAEPLGALAQDVRHVREGLDVVHRGRHAEGAVLRREGRLLARLALLALERLEQPGLLAADVGAGAALSRTTSCAKPRAHARRRRGSPPRSASSIARSSTSRRAARTRRARRRRSSPRRSPRRRSGCPRASGAAPRSISSRSLKEPGSDSSALQTRYFGLSVALRHERPLQAGARSRRRRGPGGPSPSPGSTTSSGDICVERALRGLVAAARAVAVERARTRRRRSARSGSW